MCSLTFAKEMKIRAMTQTVSGTKNSCFIVCAALPPIGGSVEIDDSTIIVRTFGCETKITLDNYQVFRFYRWWSLLNYRIIIEYEGGYRAVDFRGRGEFKHPQFFTRLGYDITIIDQFWRGSYDSKDGDDYGLEFSTTS